MNVKHNHKFLSPLSPQSHNCYISHAHSKELLCEYTEDAPSACQLAVYKKAFDEVTQV